jgi:uncharacterized protein
MAKRISVVSPRIIDCHAHVYTAAIIANVLSIDGLAAFLHLDTQAVAGRTEKGALKREAAAAGIDACLLLPVASASGVCATNDLFLNMVKGEPSLFTAGAIHPSTPGIDQELEKLHSLGVRALKLSSFSQKIDLESEENIRLFKKIRAHNAAGNPPFFVILDTFYQADLFFRASRQHITTPERLKKLASQFPEIAFVGAHMGGLAAPFREIEAHLTPGDNLYLDTSNAAHMLSREEFIRLLNIHGPERILFGTDWPWFGHAEEVEFIRGLLQATGFSAEEQSKVFSGNISGLLGL